MAAPQNLGAGGTVIVW